MASAPAASAPQPAMNMLSAESITVHNGKFTQVLGDYHVHGNVSAHVNQSDEAPAFVNTAPLNVETNPNKPVSAGNVQVGRDYVVHGGLHHHHVHYHYPSAKNRRNSPQNIVTDIRIEHVGLGWIPFNDHYHVYRGDKFMFCTKYSRVYREKQLPVNPTYTAMMKYATIIIDEMDAYEDEGLRYGMGYRPYYSARRFWHAYPPYEPYKPQTKPPKRNLNYFVPPFDFHIPEGNEENLYDLPCMKAHAAAHEFSTSAAPSPRAALFSHLDHSGVK
ncbi:hypothetical protein BJ912DRAFT_973554 [Pholiota molesta]|nr:hypothetical protein BJ912DRAFT_973554 [Pholiota molesta]